MVDTKQIRKKNSTQQDPAVARLWQDYWAARDAVEAEALDVGDLPDALSPAQQEKVDRLFVLRNALCENYLPLLEKQVERILHRLPQEVERGDLFSLGAEGLMKAIARFDPENTAKFETYGGHKIEYDIREGLRKMDHLKRLQREKASRCQAVVRRFYAQEGRDPSDAEMSELLGIEQGEVGSYRRALRGAAARVA